MANPLSSFLTSFQAGNQIADSQRDQRQQNRLSQLASGVIGGDPQAYVEAASISPQAADNLASSGDQLTRRARGAAKYLQSALQGGNPDQIAAARRVIKPFMDTLHPESVYPLDRDPAQELPMIQGFLQQTAYLDQGAGNGVQSTYINRAGQRVAIMRDGTQQLLGDADARTQLRDQPGIAPSIVDLRTGSATPLQETGQQGQPFTIDPALPPEVQAQIRASEAAGQPYTGSQQLIAPRQDPSQIITPYQGAQLAGQARDDARADEALRLQQELAAQALADKQAAAQEKQIGIQRAAQNVLDSVDDSLSTIARLRAHPGFKSLGTPTGDLATAIPVVRTDAKGAQAILDTVSAQSLINTLNSLKQASATGASGFGSLTEQEGNALRAATANLNVAMQSNQGIDEALQQIERILTRTRNRTMDSIQARGGFPAPELSGGGAGSAPAPAQGGSSPSIDALLEKYR